MKYIFEIQLKNGQAEQDYVDAWKKGSALIQTFPGAQGTALFRKIGEPTKLIAIATWASKQSRDDGMAKLKQTGSDIQKVLVKHKEFGGTNILGEFEEIASVGPK